MLNLRESASGHNIDGCNVISFALIQLVHRIILYSKRELGVRCESGRIIFPECVSASSPTGNDYINVINAVVVCMCIREIYIYIK